MGTGPVFVACIVGLTLAMPLASAHSMSGGGSFLPPGNPTTKDLFGVSEHAAACNPGGPGDGIDGQWWNIGGFGDGAHTLTLSMAASIDVDAYFYTGSCDFIHDDSACATSASPEVCTVPSGAAFMIVNNFSGSGSYSFTIA